MALGAYFVRRKKLDLLSIQKVADPVKGSELSFLALALGLDVNTGRVRYMSPMASYPVYVRYFIRFCKVYSGGS